MNKFLILTILIFASCSPLSLKMRRPEESLYNALKDENLFGTWTNSRTKMTIFCTGEFYFHEKRDGKEYNKDKGGHVSELDINKGTITVSSVFGDSLYHYSKVNEDSVSVRVGDRAGVVGALVDSVKPFSFSSYDDSQRLVRRKKVDCDKAPKNLGELLKQSRNQEQ